jgi:hypothetical protein
MDLTLVFGSCTRLERYTGLVAIEFDDFDADPLNGTATIEDGRLTYVSTSAGCTTGPQAGQSTPWGMNPTPASGPASNITFSSTENVAGSGPSAGAVFTTSFQGAKNGESITGTLRYNARIDQGQFGIVTGATSATVTLTPH